MSINANGHVTAELGVRIASENGTRRLYLTIDDAPDWLLGMIRDGGPYTVSGSTYRGGKSSSDGPDVVTLMASKVFSATEPPASASPSEGSDGT